MITYVHWVRRAKRGVVRSCNSSQIPLTIIKIIIFVRSEAKILLEGLLPPHKAVYLLCPRDAPWKIMHGSLLPLACGRNIGRHYQPKPRNFVILVTFTTVARVLEGGRHKRSPLRVSQGLHLTSEHYESSQGWQGAFGARDYKSNPP
jgi:hypothetical protein